MGVRGGGRAVGRPLPTQANTTQKTEHIQVHPCSEWIRTHDPSSRAATVITASSVAICFVRPRNGAAIQTGNGGSSSLGERNLYTFRPCHRVGSYAWNMLVVLLGFRSEPIGLIDHPPTVNTTPPSLRATIRIKRRGRAQTRREFGISTAS
jgi:hypothetical protein